MVDERCAREVTLLEAFETVEPPSPSWTEDDRAWADRIAREASDPDASEEAFIAQRARHALQRLGPREPAALRAMDHHRPTATRWLLVMSLIAFGLGLVADSIGSSRRINLLAPPLWGVIAWNVVVYAVLAVSALARLVRRRDTGSGPLARGLRRLMGLWEGAPSPARGASAGALRRFLVLWSARSGRLAMQRAATVLHVAAAALGLGLVAGLYARGLVFDYRAAWESTFLSPATAHALLTMLLAPASQLSGIALPEVGAFEAMRALSGDPASGAPAAEWIHLFGLTLVLIVVLPRALLAGAGAVRIGVRSRRFGLPLEEPYHQRLLRLRRGGTARVGVWPYGLTPSPGATLGLRSLFGEAFGPRVAVQVAPTIAYGAEEDARLSPDPALTHVVALFDMNATPESENQGLFLTRVAAAAPSGAVLCAVIDESAFLRRFGALPQRVEQRREAWRDWARPLRVAPVFLDLSAPADGPRVQALESGFSPAAAVRA